MKKYIFISLLALVINFSGAFSQQKEVRQCIGMVAKGQIKEVKEKLASLSVEYPEDPGVKLLKGILTDDASKAVEIYDDIVNSNPKSEWADDAYWRIIQFHAVTGSLNKAKEELDIFRKNYPSSEFLIPAADIVRLTDNINNKKNKIQNAADSLDKAAAKLKADSAASAIAEAAEDEKGSIFGLQVGVYSTKAMADEEIKKYRAKRIEAAVIPKFIDKKKMFSVVIGNYTGREKAESASELIKGVCGCNPIIVKKNKIK